MTKMFRTLLTSTVAVAGAIAVSAPASAAVLSFDDISASGVPVQNGYQGFNWTDVYVINGANRGDGYAAGVVSAPNVIYNGFGNLATVSSANGFTLGSAFFTAAFVDQAVTVIGYNGSTQVFSDTFNTLRSGPTFHSFNSSSITSFTFRAGNGNQVVIDNLTLNAGAVPETATWGMMIAGFGLMGASMRYRRRSAKVTFA